MREVFRLVHTALPNGEIFFLEEEKVRMRRQPYQRIEKQESQSGNITLVHVGACRSIFTITMNMFFRDTVEKLDMMRDAQAQTAGLEEFLFYPFWLYDKNSRFPILWTNVADFFEQHARGRIEGNWEQVVVWEEIVTGACVVPS